MKRGARAGSRAWVLTRGECFSLHRATCSRVPACSLESPANKRHGLRKQEGQDLLRPGLPPVGLLPRDDGLGCQLCGQRRRCQRRTRTIARSRRATIAAARREGATRRPLAALDQLAHASRGHPPPLHHQVASPAMRLVCRANVVTRLRHSADFSRHGSRRRGGTACSSIRW